MLFKKVTNSLSYLKYMLYTDSVLKTGERTRHASPGHSESPKEVESKKKHTKTHHN